MKADRFRCLKMHRQKRQTDVSISEHAAAVSTRVSQYEEQLKMKENAVKKLLAPCYYTEYEWEE